MLDPVKKWDMKFMRSTELKSATLVLQAKDFLREQILQSRNRRVNIRLMRDLNPDKCWSCNRNYHIYEHFHKRANSEPNLFEIAQYEDDVFEYRSEARVWVAAVKTA
jgi:hypothetical protein